MESNQTNQEIGSSPELFVINVKLQIPTELKDSLDTVLAKYSLGHLNYFALTLQRSNDLLLLCDGRIRTSLGNILQTTQESKKWTLRHIPWFQDPSSRISALSFDEDGLLYIGTSNGMIYELNASVILNSPPDNPETDLKEIFHFNEFRISDILIWFKEATKTILCNGGNGKIIVIPPDAYPVIVTFTSPVIGMELYVNNTGCACALVSLESGANLFTVLNDMDIPQEERFIHKSIFKRAKENIISRFGSLESDKKLFGRNNSINSTCVTSTESVTPGSLTQKPLANIKFQALDDLSRGLMRKMEGTNQFFRHFGNKLDFFDADFRQTSSLTVPPNLKKLYLIQKIYYCVDKDRIRIMVIHNGVIKEFAILPFLANILSIEAVGENTPHSVFVIAENGVYEMSLKNNPLSTCVEVILNEANTPLDVLCAALNVPKSQVYVLAGDKFSDEGKFAKTIIYYKLAGMSYAKIVAKFGSRGLVPAMLCFHELAEQDRTRSNGSLREKCVMADVAILGKIEQFLRLGDKNVLPTSKVPRSILQNTIITNMYYSTKTVAMALCYPELLWTLPFIGKTRLAWHEIVCCLFENRAKLDENIIKTKAFLQLLIQDWMCVYSISRPTFLWYREIITNNLTEMDQRTLYKLVSIIIPWRRELQHKLFSGLDLNEIIDFTGTTDAKVVIADYTELFITIILEVLRRNHSKHCSLPRFLTRPSTKSEFGEGRNASKTETRSLSHVKNLLSASPSSCSCIRNGKVYSWGENRSGRLGVHENREIYRTPVDIPSPLNLSGSLRITIESISIGHTHSLALTCFGTILVWGSNSHGQLGVGRGTMWTGRPVALELPDIFISVAAGAYHSVALDYKNRVWTWGWGIYGQLGNDGIENKFHPQMLNLEHKILTLSAGHSHTGLITSAGKVLTFGCSHFGQLGHGNPNIKVKIPKIVTSLPPACYIECGTCSTAVVTENNHLYYFGLNPSSLKSLLTRSRRGEPKIPPVEEPPEEDYHSPILIETSQLAGDIVKLSIATTHLILLTSLGLVYTWGLGKSGQLVRPEDDNKTLEPIDCGDTMIVASDVACAADCTFIMERDTGKLFGCGFNSFGQLGRMESDQEASILTIRTKKRVVKVRQPANIYIRPREIIGLPKITSDQNNYSSSEVCPSYEIVDQNFLEWCLRTWVHHYSARSVINECLRTGNLAAAVVVETLIEDHEAALKHNLDRNNDNPAVAIDNYVNTVEKKSTCLDQACHFLAIVVQHWAQNNLHGLEEILETYRRKPNWNLLISLAVKDKFATGDDSARWMSANFTPVFILSCFHDSRDVVVKRHQQQGKVHTSLDTSEESNYHLRNPTTTINSATDGTK